jgi:hypothetical protein
MKSSRDFFYQYNVGTGLGIRLLDNEKRIPEGSVTILLLLQFNLKTCICQAMIPVVWTAWGSAMPILPEALPHELFCPRVHQPPSDSYLKRSPERLAELKKQIQDMRRCRSMDGTWSFLKTKAKIFFPGRSI